MAANTTAPAVTAPSPKPAAPATKPAPHVGRAVLAHAAEPGATAPAGGMPAHVREAIEQSYGVDLSGVRVHAGPAAESANDLFSARAFTFGEHVALGRGERASDLGLMAHEAAHVVQQQHAPAVQRASAWQNDAFEREADRASSAVLRGETFGVNERVGHDGLQRLGLSDVLDYLAGKAKWIPGFTMFTFVIGFNPINMETVDRSPANFLRAAVEFIPGGPKIVELLDRYGVFEKAGVWIDQQLGALKSIGGSIKKGFDDFIDSLHLSDILHPGDVWDRAERIFTDPVARIKAFLAGIVEGIVKFVKDAILMPLAHLAEKSRGWDLLIAVLGKNPITGEPVPQTADTLIGGFMKLIGEEEVYENIQKAHALPRAWAWFKSTIAGVLGFVREFPALFIDALKSLTIEDIIVLPRAFVKVGAVFGDFAGRFFTWGGDAVWTLLQIVFEVVAPGAIPYLKKVGGAFKTILKNPIGFVRNLVHAGKLGFQQFADNIGTHLKAGFIEWLTGTLTGVYLPKSFDLKEIVQFVLSVLAVTWQSIRGKLVKAIGEPAVKAMETGFDLVVTLVKDGPAAAWEKIKEDLASLRDTVLQGIMDFITTTVVRTAIEKIVSLLVPGGAFLQAIIAIYDTIVVFIDKLSKIIQVATAFLDSLVAIASGEIGGAAKKVESTLAGLITLAISFLAGFLHLGKISDKVKEIIGKIRDTIDKALDKVVDWVVSSAKKLFSRVFGKKERENIGSPTGAGAGDSPRGSSTDVSLPLAMQGKAHIVALKIAGGKAVVTLATDPTDIRTLLADARAKARDDASMPKDHKALALEIFAKMEREVSDEGIISAYNKEHRNNPAVHVEDVKDDPAFATAFLQTIKDQLIVIALSSGSDDLRTLFAVKGIPQKRFLPASIRDSIREKLYYKLLSVSWETMRAKVMQEGVEALKLRVDAMRSARDSGNQAEAESVLKELTARDLIVKGFTVNTVLDGKPRYETAPYFSVDHDPSVAVHWSSPQYGGNDVGDGPRRLAAAGEIGAPLRMMTRQANSSKGSSDANDVRHTFLEYVGPGFTSEFATDEHGTADTKEAKLILGQPFLTENNVPLIFPK